MFKKIAFLTPLLALVLLFGAVSPAHAQGIVAGDTIPAGITVDDDVILFGETVTIDGDVNGNVFALGGTVTINGKVDGSVLCHQPAGHRKWRSIGWRLRDCAGVAFWS